jgi:hypothetical protein
MAAMSDYLEQAILNHLRGTAFPAVPTNFFVGLYSTATDDAGGGTELTGNGYARVQVSPATGSWSAPGVGGNVTNAVEIAFPAATGSPWSTATHFAIHDLSTGGNRYYHGALTASKTAAVGDVIRFAIGALSITLA